jgi:hypothetical protein
MHSTSSASPLAVSVFLRNISSTCLVIAADWTSQLVLMMLEMAADREGNWKSTISQE